MEKRWMTMVGLCVGSLLLGHVARAQDAGGAPAERGGVNREVMMEFRSVQQSIRTQERRTLAQNPELAKEVEAIDAQIAKLQAQKEEKFAAANPELKAMYVKFAELQKNFEAMRPRGQAEGQVQRERPERRQGQGQGRQNRQAEE